MVKIWILSAFELPSGRPNIAIEHGPFIVDLPIKNGGSLHSYVSLPEGITSVIPEKAKQGNSRATHSSLCIPLRKLVGMGSEQQKDYGFQTHRGFPASRH